MDEDEFYSIRSAYYIGDYSSVEKEATNLSHLRGIKSKERDSFLCRALIAQKKYKKAQSIAGKSVQTPMLAVKQLLIYAQAQNIETKELVTDQLSEYLKEDPDIEQNVTFSVIAAQIFCNEKMFKQALELVIHGKSLEQLLVQCEIYLKMARFDLASKTVSLMCELEDDDPLTSLASIALYLFDGGDEKVNECLPILEDLMQSNTDTILLKNLQCVANIHLQNYTQAWKQCREAKNIAQKYHLDTDAVTLANSIVCLQHLTKGQEILPKLYSELKRISPDHAFIRDREEMNNIFDKCAQNFQFD